MKTCCCWEQRDDIRVVEFTEANGIEGRGMLERDVKTEILEIGEICNPGGTMRYSV